MSVSKACPRPAAGTPLRVKGLSVSKVPMADSLTAPPLGALGSAYSKCVKPGPYFMSPYIERPWAGRVVSSAPYERAATGPRHSRIARREAEAFINSLTAPILPIFVRGPAPWFAVDVMATIPVHGDDSVTA